MRVRPGRRRGSARRPRGRHAGRARRPRDRARPGPRDLRRRHQRRRLRGRPVRRGRRAAGRHVDLDAGRGRVLRLAARPRGHARAHAHAPPRQRAAARPADRRPRRRKDRGPRGPVPVRRGEHRAGRRALVHRRPGRRRGRRLGLRARPAAARRDRRGALRRRRDRQLDPGQPRGGARDHEDLRAARRPAGPAAGAAALAVAGGAGGVRDRPPPSRDRRPRGTPGGHRGARAADGRAGPAPLQRSLAAALPGRVAGERADRRRACGHGAPPRGARAVRTPPLLVRRLIVAPLVFVLELAFVVASPLLALLAALLALFVGSRGLRLLAIAVSYAARHAAGLLACLALWVASGFGARSRSARFQRAYYDLLRWFVGGVYRSIVRWARVEVRIDGTDEALSALSEAAEPAIVLSRHAGEGDSLLVLHELLCRHRRRPRLVLHEALRLDPLIDIIGHRLPNRFVSPRGGDTEVEIAAMAEGVDDDGAVLIFPEGANFTEARRARGIERLERAGRERQAAWARQMRHVSAPRPGGTLAAIRAVPHAHVVVVGHVGMPVGFGELWQRLPAEQTVELRLWLVDELPELHDERIDRLFGWWRALDAWVEARHPHAG